MSPRTIVLLLAAGAVLIAPIPVSARQNIVLNGSMEAGAGAGGIDPQVAAEWTEFGVNVERSATVNRDPNDGGWALKAFGEPDSTSAGGSQIVEDVTAGQSVGASVWVQSPTFDKLGGSGEAGLVLEFLDLFGGTLALYDDYPLNSASPGSTWIKAEIAPQVAPAGTYEVRVSCRLRWSPADVFGAAYWDGAEVSVDSGPNALLNADFEQAGASAGQSPVGIDEWTGFNDQEKYEAGVTAYHGVNVLQLGVRELYNGLWQNMGDLASGDTIRLRAWAMHPSSDPLEESAQAGIKLEFDPSVDVPGPEENLAFTAAEPNDVWTEVTLTTVVPAGATIARVVAISSADPGETGVVYFDDAHAGETSAPGDNLLLNADFELGGGVPADWSDFGQASKDCFSAFRSGVCGALTEGTETSGVYQEVPVTPGQDLYLSIWVYTPSFNPIVGAQTMAGIKVEWAAGGVPADVDLGEQGNEITSADSPDTWIPLTIEYTMGPGEGALARFTNLTAKNTALGGVAYFDACEAVVLNRFDGSDVNGDDNQDLIDIAWLQQTFTGAGGGLAPFNSITFDLDDDEDVDMDDVDYLLPRMTGP